MSRIKELLQKIRKPNGKTRSLSDVFSFSNKNNVLDLKEKPPIIEIHLPVLASFLSDHKKNIYVILSGLLIVSILTSYFQVSASVATFFPQTCLGGWQYPENAQGIPVIEEGAAPEKFNEQNSAILGNSSAQLFCGTFKGDIPADVIPKKFVLSFNWSVDDGSVDHKKDMVVRGPFGSGEPTSTPSVSVEEPTQVPLPETVTSSETTSVEIAPPADASVITIPSEGSPQPAPTESVSNPEPTPASDSAPQSLLDIFTPNKVHAEDSVLEAAPVEVAPTPEASIPAVPVPVSESVVNEIVPPTTPATSSDDGAPLVSPTADSLTTATVASSSEIDTAPVSVSPAVVVSPTIVDDAFAKVSYTLDGKTWNILGRVGVSDWKHAEFEIPLGAWSDISKLQVSIDTIQSYDKQPVVYLDAMQIAVEYEQGKILQKPTVIIKNADAQILSGKSDFNSDEAPVFAVLDPGLSTGEIANLVEDKKAEVVHDTDKVLANTTHEDIIPVPDTTKAESLFDTLKNSIFPSNETNSSSPSVESSIVEPTQEVKQAGNSTSSVEVIEGPAIDTDALSTDTIFQGSNENNTAPASNPEPVEVPSTSTEPTNDTSTSIVNQVSLLGSYFNEARNTIRKTKPLFPLFGPLMVSAEDILNSGPTITSARVLDYYGNPTTIKTTIETVTVDGVSSEGVSIEKPKREFRAGRYTLEVTIETTSAIIISQQDFTWGVLAINTDKAIYTEGDNAYLQMGVLNDHGDTICGADLDLEITSPSGVKSHFTTDDKSIVREKKCGHNNVIDVPDYYAHYGVPIESGTYVMILVAKTENGTKKITDTFDVDHPHFDVVRAGPTRIFPVSTYPMTLRITPDADWDGIVTETIPSSFGVSRPKVGQVYSDVKTSGDLTTIYWDVHLKAGKETVLSYVFKAPDISPQFYLLGPLALYDDGVDTTTGTPTFQETRFWQMASDAVCTAAANGNWNTSGTWSCGHVPLNSDSVVINSSVTVTMDVASASSIQGVTINGTLNTITSGTSYALTTTTLTIGATGTLTANASTITLTGTSGTLFTLTSGGTFTQGTSEVIVTSASGTPTLLSAATTFHRLTINSAATVINAGAAITMSSANSANRLYVQAGVLNDGGNQITGTSNGTLIVNSAAALCIGGTAAATNATCDSAATPTTATTFPTNYTNGNITLTAGSATAGWYNASWGYRTKITIDHTKVPSTQSNFPVLISKTDTRFKTVANSGHMGNAGATDLVITSSDGTTKLNHQIEYYVATTGQIIAWVKVATLSSSVDTDLYMYYGNAGVADQQNATGTWNSNFKQVLHVSDGTTLSVADSTGNYNGTNSSSTATTGQIDGGAAQTAGAYISNGANLYTMIGGSASHTISFWINLNDFSGGDQYVWDFDTAAGIAAFMNIAGGGIVQWGYSASYRQYNSTPISSTGTWYYVVAQKSAAGDNGKLYVNGSLQTVGSGTLGDPANTGSSNGQWGRYHTSTTLANDGIIDEMHILNTATSADWITTEYNNQNAPSTFIPTWATEEVSTVADAIVYYNADADTTISSTPTYRDLKLTPQLTGAHAYTFASGSVTINGNFTINPTRSSAALLTVNMGGDITVASTKTTTITRTTSATSTLDTRPSSTDWNLSSGLIVIGTSCTLDAGSAASTITLTGTTGTLLTNTGTFTQGSSTVSVTSATGPVALVSASQTFHILTINSASASTVVNATAAVTIDNASGAALTVTSGVFNDSGFGIATSGSTNNTLTLGSSGTLCLGGAAGSNTATTCDTSATSTTTRGMPSFATYSFNASSTVIYLSDADTTISSTQTYGNLIFRPRFVATARAYTLGGAMTINGDFTIQPTNFAALLTVNPAGTITVASGKTTTISGTTATSKLCLKATGCSSGTSYDLSTGLLNIAAQGTLDATSASSTISLTATSGTLFTRAGTFTITSGTPTVALTGNGAATISSGAITFYDLTQTGTGTKTVGSSSALTINHNLTVSAGEFAPNLQTVTGSGTNVISVASGATLYVDASTWAGNYSSFETRTISSGSTVDYKLAGTQTVDSTLTYSNLVISGASGTKSPDGNITSTLTFVQSGGNTFDLLPSATDYNLTTGNLTIGTGCTLDGTSSSAIITLTGTSGTLFTKTGTYTQGTTEVVVTSASGTPTLLSAATTFHRLTINALATVVNAGAAITMSSTSALNRLYVQKGVLNDGGNQIVGTSNGTLLVAGGGTLCIGGTAASTNATCDSGATPTSATTFPTNYTNGNITLYSSASAASWYSSSWGYRTAITIDYSKVSTTNQTDFPVLINSTNADWKYTSSGGHVGNSDGSDILFTSDDGTTKLKHEIERYTSTSGELIAWVKVPTLSYTANTVLYMYYGNAGVAAQADATNVWDSSFKSVLHLGDGTTLSASSSTGTNSGTITGTMSAVTGKIGGAGCANGTTQCSGTASTSNGLTFTTFSSTTPTISAWIKLDNASGYQNVAALNNSNGVWLNAGKMDLYTSSDHNANTSVGTGSWVYVAMTYDGTTIRYYYNGATDGTGSASAFNYQINGMFKDANGVAETLKGSMDEIRFSNTVRSAGWITTEYNTMNSPSTFYSLGMENVYGASSSTVYYNADAATTVSATPTYADLKFRPVLTGDKTYTLATAALTINGDFTINPSGSANTLLVNTGGHITAAYGTISITKQGSSFSTLDLRPSSTDYNLSSKYLTIATGGTLDATSAASSITVTGTSGTLMTFGGTFNVGTTTVSVTGNGTATLNSGTGNFYNLTLNATGTKTLGGNITLDSAGTLTITTGTLDTSSGSSYQISAGKIDIANSASAILTANASSITVSGTSGVLLTLGASGVFNGGTSLVTLSGNGTATVNSGAFTGSNSFYDFTNSGTGTKTLGGAITVTDIFSVTGGTLNTGANNALITKSFNTGASGTFTANASSITTTGNWTNNGTFTSGTSLVTMNGGTTVTVAGTTSFYDLTITHTTDKEVDFAASGGTPTYTVTHTFTVTGNSGHPIKLRSATPATKWDFLPSGTASADYVDVSDGGCHAGAISITPSNFTDSGNNDSCWLASTPTLTFSISSATVNLGTLLTSTTATGSHTLSASTNGSGGFVITYNGPTLTSGSNIVPAYPALSSSAAGTAGFGINLKLNTSPSVGAAVVTNSGTCGIATNYNTANSFTFATSATTAITNVTAAADCVYTASYIANISSVTPAGTYSTAITYIATGTF